MAAKLEANKDQAYLSYELATIKLDVELDVSLEEIKTEPADDKKLLELFERFQFRTWIREMTGEEAPKAERPAAKSLGAVEKPEVIEPNDVAYQVVTNVDQVDQIVAAIKETKLLAYIPVFEKAHYMNPEWVGLSVASKPGQAWYIPFKTSEGDALPFESVIEKLGPLFDEHAIVKVGYDIKADHHWFGQLKLKPSRLLNDVQVMAFVYDSTIKRDKSLSTHFSHLSLDNLAIVYLQKSPKLIDDFLGKAGKRQLSPSAVPASDIGLWWAERVDFLVRLSQWLEQGLASRSLTEVYEKIERPLSKVLSKIEDNGVMLDTEYLNDLSAQFKTRLAEIEQKAHALAGKEFNLDSPKQLAEILFETMELPVVAKTASGAPSTNEEVLSELAQEHELPKLILQSRHLRKLVGTYTDPLPTMVINQDESHRLHTTYNQTGAQTGRLNSNDPNLQNIPIRTSEGRSIRKAFVAPKGYKIVAADYSQIELRIMTHLSQDENLIAAFKEGKDIHRATAADVMSIDESEVTSEQRRSAKAINFGLIYGMSAFGLAKQLGISRTEAKGYVDAYFERYPGVRRYMDETRAEAAETGYVQTVFGRRLYLPGIQSSNQMARKGAERTAINAPMQGTAADIIKMAMVDVENWLSASSLRAKMIMQVHDELVFEVHEDDMNTLIDGVRFRMQHCASLDVPLIVDVDSGNSWEEAH
jgi:DNA polymerase-1